MDGAVRSVPFALLGIGLTGLGFMAGSYTLRAILAAGPMAEQKIAAGVGAGLVTVIIFAAAILALKRGFGERR